MVKIDDREVKLIIFDLDGTLIDSCTAWSEVDEAFFNKRGLTVPDDYHIEISHMGLDNAAIYTNTRFNLNEDPEMIKKEWIDSVIHKYQNDIILKPGAAELLTLLEGKVVLTCATAGFKEAYEPCLRRNGILDYFSLIKDVKEYPNGKSSPEIFLDIAKAYNIEPKDILVIDDTVRCLDVVKEASFQVAAIYEKTCIEEEKKKVSYDFYVNDFYDLIKKIKITK